jgi:hypothetical protein
VTHFGKAGAGHYYCHAKCPEQAVHKYNDEAVSTSKFELQATGTTTPYIMFYRQCTEAPDDCTYEEDVIQVTDAASNADEDTDGGTNSDEEMPFQL